MTQKWFSNDTFYFLWLGIQQQKGHLLHPFEKESVTIKKPLLAITFGVAKDDNVVEK